MIRLSFDDSKPVPLTFGFDSFPLPSLKLVLLSNSSKYDLCFGIIEESKTDSCPCFRFKVPTTPSLNATFSLNVTRLSRLILLPFRIMPAIGLPVDAGMASSGSSGTASRLSMLDRLPDNEFRLMVVGRTPEVTASSVKANLGSIRPTTSLRSFSCSRCSAAISVGSMMSSYRSRGWLSPLVTLSITSARSA